MTSIIQIHFNITITSILIYTMLDFSLQNIRDKVPEFKAINCNQLWFDIHLLLVYHHLLQNLVQYVVLLWDDMNCKY